MSDKYAAEGVTPKQPVRKFHTLKFHLNIGESDRARLISKAGDFLTRKSQVKIIIQLKGREKANPIRGLEFLNRIIEELSEKGSPSNIPDTKSLFVTFNPKKRS